MVIYLEDMPIHHGIHQEDTSMTPIPLFFQLDINKNVFYRKEKRGMHKFLILVMGQHLEEGMIYAFLIIRTKMRIVIHISEIHMILPH